VPAEHEERAAYIVEGSIELLRDGVTYSDPVRRRCVRSKRLIYANFISQTWHVHRNHAVRSVIITARRAV
jgi:hypothetical protein